MNKAALKLPDQLLVRYYRQGLIDRVVDVKQEKKTRDITVKLTLTPDGKLSVERWQHLVDLGWIPAQS